MIRHDYWRPVEMNGLPGPLRLTPSFPFAGRARELQALKALVPREPDDGLRVALIGGEAGSGKSRLVRELAHAAAAADGERRVVDARERDAARDVIGGEAADDHRWMAVDHPVVNCSGLVVRGVAGSDDAVAQVGQLLTGDVCKRCGYGHVLLPDLRLSLRAAAGPPVAVDPDAPFGTYVLADRLS